MNPLDFRFLTSVIFETIPRQTALDFAFVKSPFVLTFRYLFQTFGFKHFIYIRYIGLFFASAVKNSRMNVEELVQKLKSDFCNSFDLILLKRSIGNKECLYAYFDGSTDKELLERGVIAELFSKENAENTDIDFIDKNISSSGSVETLADLDSAENTLVEGKVVLFVDNAFFGIDLRKYEKRSITEPPTSSVLKGPRTGFVEDISTNVSLIRRRIKNKDLAIQHFSVGKYTGTDVAVCWITSITNEDIVKTVTERISKIDIDGIIDSSYIAMLIEDNKSSLFSQTASQEKPDIVASKLLEGRVAIVVDGSPMVLTLPCMLIESFQDSEDYYRRNRRTSFVRILRFLGLLLSILLPAGYVAVQEYQYQFLPLKFMVTIINATNGTPFTPTYEMFLVLIIFDILNEASIRMPRFVGMALSIVGAIVLGETAVQAGLLSSPAVLVMALSAIGMYTTPTNMGTFSLIRLIFLACSSLFGMLGLIIACIVFVSSICSLKSFGIDFTAPYAPVIKNDLQDGFLKKSINDTEFRPRALRTHNLRKKGKNDE